MGGVAVQTFRSSKWNLGRPAGISALVGGLIASTLFVVYAPHAAAAVTSTPIETAIKAQAIHPKQASVLVRALTGISV